MLALSDRWAPVLSAEPETGMGYQVATVHLTDGRVFDRVVIVSGAITSIRGESQIPFDESEIRRIVVTHDKPD